MLNMSLRNKFVVLFFVAAQFIRKKYENLKKLEFLEFWNLKLEIWKLVLLFNKENIGMEAESHKSF
jgi:hypothetical protein